MIPEHQITEIKFVVDEFFKEFDKTIKEHSLQEFSAKKRNRKFTMSASEVMTILILFHSFSVKNLKAFYKDYHCRPKVFSFALFIKSIRL